MVINDTLDNVSIHPVTTKRQASFLTQWPEKKETTQGFHHEANCDFLTVSAFNGSDRRKLRILYNTNLIDRLEIRTTVQNENTPKHASYLQQGTKVKLKKMWKNKSLFFPE